MCSRYRSGKNNNTIMLNWVQKPTSEWFIIYYENHQQNQQYKIAIAMKNKTYFRTMITPHVP